MLLITSPLQTKGNTMLNNILATIKDVLAEEMETIRKFNAQDFAHWEVAEYTMPSIELCSAALKSPHLLTWEAVDDEFSESGKRLNVAYLGVDLNIYFDA